MSVTSKNPLRTAETLMTLGGAQTVTPCYSGGLSGYSPPLVQGLTVNGGDVQLALGAGRLKDVVVHQGLLSGQSTIFYDTGTVTSGGPFALSGHKVLAVIPASPPGGNSGTFVPAGMYPFDIPFSQGLAMRTQSGGPGITATFTLETANILNP